MLNMYDKQGNEKNILEESDIQSGSGYVKLPDGTMIQYGSGMISDSGGAMKHINLPLNFNGFGYTVLIQNVFSYNSEIMYSVAGLSISGFDVYPVKQLAQQSKL